MKEIKIIDTNEEKINRELNNVQGRARERLVYYMHIKAMTEKIERQFDLPKKYMDGIIADVDFHAQKLPNCYKYKAYSTRVILEKKKGNWYLVDASRCGLRQNNDTYKMILPEATKQKLVEKYESSRNW